MQLVKTLIPAAALVSVALCRPAEASSWAQTEPAVANCVPYTMSDFGLDLGFHNFGIMNHSSDAYALTCPITSQTGLIDATTLYGVQVLAYDGHSGKSVTASLCVSNPTTGSISCGATVASGNSTVGSVALWLSPPSGTFLSYYTASVWVYLIGHQCIDSGLLGCNEYRESELRSYNIWRK